MTMETGISVERAIELIEQNTLPVGTERIEATRAHGRILAEDVCAPISQPPWPRSPLDGYALRAADSAGASKDTPRMLRVVDTIYAGGWSEVTVQPGECVRLMTGAPIPAGCDCVIRQEDTDLGAERVRIYKALSAWDNYCKIGDDFLKGDKLLPAGTKLNGNALGVLASAGLHRDDERLTVYKRVRCAVLCTGDELVPNAVRPLPPGKIYSSNEAVLSSRLSELGMELIVVRGEFTDDPAALAAAIREAAGTADVIFTTGGVSVGAKDILHETLPLLNADRVFWQVCLKPGSPMMFSIYNGKPLLSLSGNPFAASATFELFGRVLLSVRSGDASLRAQVVTAELDTPFEKFGRGRRFVRSVFRDGHVTIPQGHSSGQLASAVGTNCLAEIPPADAPLRAGSTVRVWLL